MSSEYLETLFQLTWFKYAWGFCFDTLKIEKKLLLRKRIENVFSNKTS